MLSSVTKKEMSDLCRKYGPTLKLQVGSMLDPIRVLWALSGNETSFGALITPHHEDAYCPFSNGIYYRTNADVKNQTADVGCIAHMSYGPLQILWYNVVKFYKAPMLNPDSTWLADKMIFAPEVGLKAAVDFLNAEILGRQACKTLDEIADAYNSGNAHDANIPVAYIAKAKLNYDVPLL